MGTIQLPPDFKEFLRLLNSKGVEHLLIGGYAVGYYGYPRATADLDIWISNDAPNAVRMVQSIREFGFDVEGLSPDLFQKEHSIVRMGMPPLRIEIFTTISGVNFAECYGDRTVAVVDDVQVNLISLDHLKANKRASGRLRDLSDLEYLP